MTGFLFQRIVFGPVHSRRLGLSLGINLLPQGCKVCTFNCTYCECGFTAPMPHDKDYPPMKQVMQALESKLAAMRESGDAPDSITFAGNGEPTMHPQFKEIMEGTVTLRNLYFPRARVAVLSNATCLSQPGIAGALASADLSMLKLDAGSEDTFRRLNRPEIDVTLEGITRALEAFTGHYIIQTMFVEGKSGGEAVDNTSGNELDEYIHRLQRLRPDYVDIYSIDRATPGEGLIKVGRERLEETASRIGEGTGLIVNVY